MMPVFPPCRPLSPPANQTLPTGKIGYAAIIVPLSQSVSQEDIAPRLGQITATGAIHADY